MILQLINIDFTVGLSHTFTILYQLKFFSAGQLLIITNNPFFGGWGGGGGDINGFTVDLYKPHWVL